MKETLSTSEKEVPKHKNALEEKYKEHQEKEPLNGKMELTLEKEKHHVSIVNGLMLKYLQN